MNAKAQKMAADLKDYLLAKKSLIHPSSGMPVKLPAPISAHELDILARIKRSEHTTSELENRIFTRGGPTDDPRDIMTDMPTSKRIAHLASLDHQYTHHEMRNVLKNRAHSWGYIQTAQTLSSDTSLSAQERMLARKVEEKLTYKDFTNNLPVVDFYA